jgi:hypothetical protein
MRQILLTACLALIVTSTAALAQSDRKKQDGPRNVIAPKGTVFAPAQAKPKATSTTMAPRGSKNVPLTREECRGLGGKIEPKEGCASGACYTADPNGVVRSVCLTQ